jgi:iron transport multicopper oxidase
MMLRIILPTLAALVSLVSAGTVYHNWTIDWRHLAPDGFWRPVITVNGLWPPPIIFADVGDTVIVDIDNKLGNESVSIHWHGMFQHGSNAMDGAVMVTQCPIPPGGMFRYQFMAEPAGTHWWHSQNRGQAADGLRGMMIVRDRQFERSLGCWKEYLFTVSDW